MFIPCKDKLYTQLKSTEEIGGPENTELTKIFIKSYHFCVSCRTLRATGDEDTVTVPFGSFCKLDLPPVLHVGKQGALSSANQQMLLMFFR